MFQRADFTRLSAHEEAPAISIYLPTHRAGQETHDGHDRIAYKDALHEVREQLTAQGDLDARGIDTLLDKLTALTEGPSFWTHQSDALAVFASGDELEHFSLPIPFEETIVEVGTRYHLTPAARMLAPDARFYIFSLTQNETAFYEATRYSITPVRIHDVVAKNLEEVLEVYEGGETLQHHSVAGGGAGGAVFTGQGSNEDRRDERLTIYYERLNDGLMRLLEGQHEPLVIACDPQHFAEFSEKLDYKNLVDEPVGIHPNALDPTSLHAAAWKVVGDHFNRTATKLAERYETAIGAKRNATGLYDLVPAARGGRIDTLLVAQDAQQVFGTFDEARNTVKFHDARQSDSEDLLEMAIRETVANGGEVVVKGRETLPLPEGEDVAAVLRYAV